MLESEKVDAKVYFRVENVLGPLKRVYWGGFYERSFGSGIWRESRDPHLALTLVAGRKGLGKRITHSQIQKMGLALTGFIRFVDPQRLQIIGNTELAYFKTLSVDQQKEVIHKICSVDIACIVVTRNLEIPDLLLQEAEEKGIPLFQTSLRSIDFIEQVTQFLGRKTCSHDEHSWGAHGCLRGGDPDPWEKRDRKE